jgi:transcriptional regulator with XRE-family HTH domain
MTAAAAENRDEEFGGGTGEGEEAPGSVLREGDEDDGSQTAGAPAQVQGAGVVLAFGRMLKLLRSRVGLSREAFGSQLGYSPSSIASFEQGRRIPPPRFIERADKLLDAGGVLEALKDEVGRAQYPPFFRDMARLEAEAVELLSYDSHAVKGLLQTEAYMRAILRMRRPLLDDEIIEQRVSARLARQEIFSRRPAPLMSFVIEESVLRQGWGGKEVRRGQLEHLLLMAEKRSVEIQVMPMEREDNAGVDGPFTVITKKDGGRFVYMEVQGRSSLLTEPEDTVPAASRYGIIRSQALSPRESMRFIEKSLGDL